MMDLQNQNRKANTRKYISESYELGGKKKKKVFISQEASQAS